jgi:hypothetical protein
MAMFVHLAPASRLSRIRRHGIARRRAGAGGLPAGVYAVPVTRSFFVSHQWLRELRGRSPAPIAGVYFRVPDGEPVWVGHYARAHRAMTAAEAVGAFMAADRREGWEVLVPRRIAAGEIHRVRALPQVVGWRYDPDAKGRPPCDCPHCSRGEYGARRRRGRLGRPDPPPATGGGRGRRR